ncbi:MAG: DUF3467 domain-containing protein [Firmicutes bacterium]|nr:DUF3467 domain-containing protein [Bacillota bacterium]
MPKCELEDASVDLTGIVVSSPASYANFAGIEVGPFDFKLVFGLRVGMDPPSNVQTVIMSPEHAKSLAALLSDSVADFEREHGVIPHTAKPTKRQRRVDRDVQDDRSV